MKNETTEDREDCRYTDFSIIDLTIAKVLKFHRYEKRKREIEQCQCPVLDGPGYVLYRFTDLNRVVAVSPHMNRNFYENPNSVFYHKTLANIRLELASFLRWFWVGRFKIEVDGFGPGERWEGCDDEEWEAYLEDFENFTIEELIDSVADACIHPAALYGIDCYFRSPYCPCTMVI